jgi:hypothetical protein
MENGQETINLTFKVRAVKAGRPVTLEGKLKAVSLEGMKDSFFIITLRDSRISEVELRDEKGRLIWSLIPGTIRSALDAGGLSPDVLQGIHR